MATNAVGDSQASPASNAVTPSAALAPANDNFASAQVITGDTAVACRRLRSPRQRLCRRRGTQRAGDRAGQGAPRRGTQHFVFGRVSNSRHTPNVPLYWLGSFLGSSIGAHRRSVFWPLVRADRRSLGTVRLTAVPNSGAAVASFDAQTSRAVVKVTTSGRVIWPPKRSWMKASMSSNSPLRSAGLIIWVPEYDSINLR
jgi:hypothetical protein